MAARIRFSFKELQDPETRAGETALVIKRLTVRGLTTSTAERIVYRLEGLPYRVIGDRVGVTKQAIGPSLRTGLKRLHQRDPSPTFPQDF